MAFYTITIDVSDYDKSRDAMRKIMQQLLIGSDVNKPNASTQYLLQHAQWQKIDSSASKGKSVTYGAFSDVSMDYGDYWPLYDLAINIRQPTSTDKLSISSWKGDFDDEDDYCPPRGNLSYDGPRYTFSGTIWTRGH